MEELVNAVIQQIKDDISKEDETSLFELLMSTPRENLIYFLPEEQWTKFNP